MQGQLPFCGVSQIGGRAVSWNGIQGLCALGFFVFGAPRGGAETSNTNKEQEKHKELQRQTKQRMTPASLKNTKVN